MRIKVVLALIVAAAMVSGGALHAGNTTQQVVINSAQSDGIVWISITGRNFGSLVVPQVVLGGQALTINSFTDTTIDAVLPAGTLPGTYLLQVSTGNGANQSDVMDVTLGAAGPKGDKGDTGGQGLPGAAGQTGPAGATGATGAKGLNWRGPWLSGTPYVIDDAVSYNGSSYTAVVTNPTEPPGPPSTSWSLVALKGDTGAQGPPGTFTGTLSGDVGGAPNATVVATVGGMPAGAIAGATTAVAAATDGNVASTIMRRSGTGDFAAGTATLTGNLILPATGVIKLGNQTFAHAYGEWNTFLGLNAGNFTNTGNINTGIGINALGALTEGTGNTALGYSALESNASGSSNVALGLDTLELNTTGGWNVAVGDLALSQNKTGSDNIAVGSRAGWVTTGSSNIDIGNPGLADENGTIRIGSAGQTRTFISGISGVSTSAPGLPVFVDMNGQLGTNGAVAGTPDNTPGAAVVRDASGNFSAGTITAALNGNATSATNFTGALAGEVSGTQSATLVNADSANTPGSIVRRAPLSGDFAAGSLALSGQLALPATSSPSTGVISFGNSRLLHAYGQRNLFFGGGNFTMTGTDNTANGYGALAQNTTGNWNTAIGRSALVRNRDGNINTAIGSDALSSNQSGSYNTAIGDSALTFASGGDYNIAIGSMSGPSQFPSVGSYNIYIGGQGPPNEDATLRIGISQQRAFIQGIRYATPEQPDAVPVLIDSYGQLGTASSSRRYKFDIADMSAATDNLMRLRPVTFRCIKHGASAPLQYGLIAEEVAEVYPELVTRDKDGQVDAVMYQFLAPMLLNEVQKQRRTIDELVQRIEALEQRQK